MLANITISAFRAALCALRPQLLIVCAHGNAALGDGRAIVFIAEDESDSGVDEGNREQQGEGASRMTDGRGAFEVVREETMADLLLESGGGELRLLFFNGCQTHILANLIARRAGQQQQRRPRRPPTSDGGGARSSSCLQPPAQLEHIVCWATDSEDEAARVFGQSFVRGLVSDNHESKGAGHGGGESGDGRQAASSNGRALLRTDNAEAAFHNARLDVELLTVASGIGSPAESHAAMVQRFRLVDPREGAGFADADGFLLDGRYETILQTAADANGTRAPGIASDANGSFLACACACVRRCCHHYFLFPSSPPVHAHKRTYRAHAMPSLLFRVACLPACLLPPQHHNGCRRPQVGELCRLVNAGTDSACSGDCSRPRTRHRPWWLRSGELAAGACFLLRAQRKPHANATANPTRCQVHLVRYQGTLLACKSLTLSVAEAGEGLDSEDDSDHDVEASSTALRNARAAQLLLKEASALASINHHNVVRLLGVCLEPGCLCLLMEYCARGSMRAVLDRYPGGGMDTGAGAGTEHATADWSVAVVVDKPVQEHGEQPSEPPSLSPRRLLLARGLPLWRRFELLRGAVHAMAALHSRQPAPVLHRDLKVSSLSNGR